MKCQCSPHQKEPHIVKNGTSEYKEIRIRLLGHSLYLGTIWWNTGKAIDCTGKHHGYGRNIRIYPKFLLT